MAMDHISKLEALLTIDTEPKILFAKGLALMKLNNFEDALKSLTKAQKLRPADSHINKTIKELKTKMESYNDFNINFGKNLNIA